MQPTDLKFPGDFTHGKTIRREVAHTISQVQIAVQQGAPVDSHFADFLADAAAKTPGFVPVGSPTAAVVSNGGTVNVENSVGNLDSPATAVVAAGVLNGVRLDATKTILTSGTKINAVAVTGTGNFATPTIANGVITGIVLSAS